MKKRNLLACICNGIIVVSTFYIIIWGVGNTLASTGLSGLKYLIYFTTLSNFFNGFTSFVVLVFNINNVVSKKEEMPLWATIVQLMGAVAVGLTFLTVIFFLVPTQVGHGLSFASFFTSDMFHMHLFNPLLTFVSFVLLNNKNKIGKKMCLWGMLPMVMYSFVYIYMVVIIKGWKDFYGFTFGGKMFMIPISLVMMYLATYLISLIYVKLHNKRSV